MKKVCLALIFTFCLVASGFGQTPAPTPKNSVGTGSGSGEGDAGGNGSGSGIGNPPKLSVNCRGDVIALRILSKPRPIYTLEAQEDDVQGTVTLRVAFLASGRIGVVTAVSGLPDGLTEQAITAAKLIKFEPVTCGDTTYSVTKAVQYNFVNYEGDYLAEDSKSIKQKAKILEMPLPEISSEEIKNLGDRIKVFVLLGSQGKVGLFKPNRAWSNEFRQKIREAVLRIKFNPAIDQTDTAVTQLKEIEYVFPKQK